MIKLPSRLGLLPMERQAACSKIVIEMQRDFHSLDLVRPAQPSREVRSPLTRNVFLCSIGLPGLSRWAIVTLVDDSRVR